MKTHKIFKHWGIISLLLLFGAIVWAVDEPVSSWTEDQTYPAIDGKHVVWEDFYNGTDYNIYRYDLSLSTEVLVYGGAGDQRYPDISGNIVVWQDNRDGNWDIYGRDITTGNVFPICTEDGNQEFPAISGHIVVWQDDRNSNDDIYGYDLDAQIEIKICTDSSPQRYPDVSVTGSYARTVVWQDGRSGDFDIYYYNLDTEQEDVIVEETGHQQRPQIDMPRVVWQDGRAGNDDIYMFTFFSLPPAIQIIENNTSDQRYPVISGNTIVWQDFRHGNGSIYGGRLGTLGTFAICAESSIQAYPAVSGNYAVWHDGRNSATKAYDIYGGALGADVWQECGTTLDFEFVLEYDSPDWTKITNHFEGVTFQSARPGCTTDTVIVDNIFPIGTSSGVCAIGNYGCEFVPGHLEMIFDNPQEVVTFYAGSRCGTYTVSAFDAATGGNQVYSETFDLSCDLTEHGVFRYVEVMSDAQNILRIEIDNDNGIHVRIDDLTFNTDLTPPLVHIASPAFDECTCEVFPIQGEVCDPEANTLSYVLKYQPVGAAPDDWTEIGTYQGQVCGGGLLAEWDTSGLAHGRYYLSLEATNGCGLSASDSTVAFVDKEFNTVTIRYPDTYDGVNGVVRGASVCIDGTVWDHLCYDADAGYQVEFRPAGSGSWMPVTPGAIGTASVINDPYATWDTTIIPDGDYELRVSSTDTCGNEKAATVTTRVDNTPPLAEIHSLANCTYLPLGSGTIPVIGAAFDNNIHSWNLSYTGGSTNNWMTISSGNANVIDALLGNWNTSGLEPCSYTLRLRVWDQALLNCTHANRNYTDHLVSVKIGADLNGDGCVNLLDFALMSDEWLTGCAP